MKQFATALRKAKNSHMSTADKVTTGFSTKTLKWALFSEGKD